MTSKNASGGKVTRYFSDHNAAPFEPCQAMKITWSRRSGEMERLERQMNMSVNLAFLKVADMAEAARLAVAEGIQGIELMEAAGLGVARAIKKNSPQFRLSFSADLE
jgi:hypothetical protein